MAVQTSYPDRLPVAYEGMVADQEPATIISRTPDEAMGFGKIAEQGANDYSVKNAAGGDATTYRGITVRKPSTEIGTTPDQGEANSEMSIITKGVVWVIASVAVSANEAVYWVPATGVFTNVSTANNAIERAVFDASAGVGGLVPVRLA